MIDNDGAITYSPVIKINFNQVKAALSLGYNPVTNGTLVFTITGQATDSKASVMIADYSGRIVMSTTVSALQTNRLEIAKLPGGFISPDGECKWNDVAGKFQQAVRLLTSYFLLL